jgi:hypothetical protein
MPKRRLYDPVVVAATITGTRGRSDVRNTSSSSNSNSNSVGSKRRIPGGVEGDVANNSHHSTDTNISASARNTVRPSRRSGIESERGNGLQNSSRNSPKSQQPPTSQAPKNTGKQPIQQQHHHQQQQQPRASNKTRRGSDIFQKLSHACQKHSIHHDLNHNERGKKILRADEMEKEDDIPDVCRKAIHSLRGLIPKLEKAIAPTKGTVNVNNEHWRSNRRPQYPYNDDDQKCNYDRDDTDTVAATLNDVLHLCIFYRSVVTGYYCPHMPHLFHFGKDIGTSEFDFGFGFGLRRIHVIDCFHFASVYQQNA